HYTVAADGGARALTELGFWPRLLIGDGDSLDARTMEHCRAAGADCRILPHEKDFTDGEAALVAALDAGYRDFAVFGAFGGLPDHQLGNLLLPLAYRQRWDTLTFYGRDCRAFYCFDKAHINGAPGDIVSLLPLSATVRGINLRGFRYPLAGADTSLGDSLCLRNELSVEEGRVEICEGIMLIIHYGG
ncbi:MAG: thiamine diphosphokinase, partial [Clostridiales bacterium]|nr:thiamine diphosphokinase [Clostridiales bacterium]